MELEIMDNIEKIICSKVKSQHYVWRKYLSEWTREKTSDGHIYCLFMDKSKIENPNIKSIATSRYFYRINRISDIEKDFIQKLLIDIISDKTPELKKVCQDWLDLFVMSNKLNILRGDSTEFDESLELFQKCIMEKIHMETENIGSKYLNKLKNKEIEFYNNEDDKMDFNIFIANQYTRTRVMKERLKENLKDTDINMENCFLPISIISATTLGFSLFKDEFQIQLLENNANIPFITGESPVVNIKADYNNDNEPKELELYYPITPQIAILLTRNKINKQLRKVESEEVNLYNEKIFQATNNQLYSCDEESLKKYK